MPKPSTADHSAEPADTSASPPRNPSAADYYAVNRGGGLFSEALSQRIRARVAHTPHPRPTGPPRPPAPSGPDRPPGGQPGPRLPGLVRGGGGGRSGRRRLRLGLADRAARAG